MLSKREQITALVAVGLLLPGSLFIGDRAVSIEPSFLDQGTVMLTIPTLIFFVIPLVFLLFVAYAALSYARDRRPPDRR